MVKYQPEHHDLDVYPIPEDKAPMFINEPWVLDASIESKCSKEPEREDDNIRIYLPLDLNQEAILRRLDYVIDFYGAVTEKNEMSFHSEVERLIAQVEIYDQIWRVRKGKTERNHSAKAEELILAFIAKMQKIPDGCSETFPFEMIRNLSLEYLGEESEA